MEDHRPDTPAPRGRTRRIDPWSILELLVLLFFFLAVWDWLHPPVPSLLFHGIDEAGQDPWTLSPRILEDALETCRRLGYRVVDAREAARALESPGWRRPPLVLLSFDDGHPNLLLRAMPLLRRFHAKATFFVNTEAGPRRWSDSQIRRAWGEGWHVQSHAHRHESLARRKGETAEAQRRRVHENLSLARRRLETLTGEAPRHLAFPCGDVDGLVIDEAHALGFRYMYGCDYGYLTILSSRENLPRFILHRDVPPERIHEYLLHPLVWGRRRLALALLVLLLLAIRRFRKGPSPSPSSRT